MVDFHRGGFFLARRCGVPVLPIVVRYDSKDAAWVGDDTFLPHYMRTTLRPTTRVTLEVLDPVAADAAASAQGLCDLVRRRFAASLAH